MKKNLIAAALIGVALIVFACVEVKDVVFPSNARTGGDFTVTATVELDATNDADGNIVVALLLPKAWDVKTNGITATYSTQGMADFWADPVKDPGSEKVPGHDVTDEVMTLATDQTEKVSSKLYPEALADKFGMLENTEEMEWVVFIGTTNIKVRGGDPNATDASTGEHYARPNDAGKAFVTITTKAGKDAVDFNSAVVSFMSGTGLGTQAFGYDPAKHGPSPDYFSISETQAISVAAYDYDKYFSFGPAEARYGDYIGVTFTPAGTDLEGVSELYLKVKAGSKDAKIAMKKEGSNYVAYFYAPSIAGTNSIAEVIAWVTNADESVVFGPEEGLLIEQAAE